MVLHECTMGQDFHTIPIFAQCINYKIYYYSIITVFKNNMRGRDTMRQPLLIFTK